MWFGYAVAKTESKDYNGRGSRYNQFLELPYHPNDVGFPLFGDDRDESGDPNGPGGYGLFQVTGSATNQDVNIPRQQIWNWQENAEAGLEVITAKRVVADGWMARQRDGNNANGVALPDHSVRTVMFSEGAAVTMNSAVAMKAYNGASRAPVGFVDNGVAPGFLLDTRTSGHYCYWKNATNQWALCRYNALIFNYVDRVCLEVE